MNDNKKKILTAIGGTAAFAAILAVTVFLTDRPGEEPNGTMYAEALKNRPTGVIQQYPVPDEEHEPDFSNIPDNLKSERVICADMSPLYASGLTDYAKVAFPMLLEKFLDDYYPDDYWNVSIENDSFEKTDEYDIFYVRVSEIPGERKLRCIYNNATEGFSFILTDEVGNKVALPPKAAEEQAPATENPDGDETELIMETSDEWEEPVGEEEVSSEELPEPEDEAESIS